LKCVFWCEGVLEMKTMAGEKRTKRDVRRERSNRLTSGK
jgi:hypothetical protein